MRDYLYGLARDKYTGFIPGLFKLLLFFLSIIYGFAVKLLSFFYLLRPYRLNCKVISIGNITVGGTGKTSLVEYIAKHLLEQGHKVAILSRGYKSKTGTIGDEPQMLQSKLESVPVLVDSNRIRSARKAVNKFGADTVILDDGLQQWKIKKDLEIVVLDSANPFGNRHILPRGIMREGIFSLKRADVFVLTKVNLGIDTAGLERALKQINSQAEIMSSSHSPAGFYSVKEPGVLISAGSLKDKKAVLFSGIGDPDSFQRLIESCGLEAVSVFRFADHHNYSDKDLDKIVGEFRKKGADVIITTEKDAARLEQLGWLSFNKIACLPARQASPCQGGARSDIEVIVLKIALKINKNEDGLHNRLRKLYSL